VLRNRFHGLELGWACSDEKLAIDIDTGREVIAVCHFPVWWVFREEREFGLVLFVQFEKECCCQ
jgi:hypothetical protein